MIPMRRGFDSSTCIFDENVLVPAPLFTAQTCIVITFHPMKDLKPKLFRFLVHASNRMMVPQNDIFLQRGQWFSARRVHFKFCFKLSKTQLECVFKAFIRNLKEGDGKKIWQNIYLFNIVIWPLANRKSIRVLAEWQAAPVIRATGLRWQLLGKLGSSECAKWQSFSAL